MLRIAICDDEVRAREALYLQLEKLLWEGEEIVYEFSSGKAAAGWIEKHPGEIDVLFLDIEMDGLNGMETAQRIRTFDRNLILVFVTGYADYVFDGYHVGAMDYLLKPIDSGKLRAVMERIRQQQFRDRETMYTVRNTDGIYRFRLRDIRYFYSDKRQVVLVLETEDRETKKYPFYQKLDIVERELREQTEGGNGMIFVRIHQRYLVNAAKVTHIDGSSVKIGEEELPMSRSLKETAVKKLARAILGVET